MYQIRRVNIGKTPQLDELAHACGELYSKTVVFFWRTVRHKGIWLKKKHLQRLFTSPKLHAHTSDACVEAFFASLKSWRERSSTDPKAKPPHKRKWFFRIEYKRSAMRLKDEQLRLSNGKGNEPLVLDWQWELPQTVVIHWTGSQYEAIATYK
jgi:putative transposase